MKIFAITGRFQPFHKGHENMYYFAENYAEKNKIEDYDIVFVIISKNKITDKNFLYHEEIEFLIHEVFPDVDVFVSPDLYYRNVAKAIIGVDPEDLVYVIGEDREKGVKNMGVDYIITPRFTSATEVRKAIMDRDYKKFKQLMPKEISDRETFDWLVETMEERWGV